MGEIMRILAVNTIQYMKISGVNRVVDRLGLELLKRDHSYTIVTIHPGGKREEGVNENGFRVIRLPEFRPNPLGREGLNIVPFLLRELKGYDVVFIHSYYSFWSVIASIMCRLLKKPTVFLPYYHGVSGPKKGVYRLFYYLFSFPGRLSFMFSDRVVCISDYERSLVRKLIDVDNKTVVIPTGVDFIDAGEGRRRDDGVIRLLYVGNLLEYKGVQYILESVRVLRERHRRNVQMSIVGTGDYRQELVRRADKLEVSDCISFHSGLSREELHRKYREADVFLLLSNSESYGIVVAEALAAGTPAIVANTTAIREFAREPGCCGIDYPPDPVRLAELIVKIYDDNPVVARLSKKIITWDTVADNFIDVIKSETMRPLAP
jgi:glycosyltransferase involved in cell wall biosynthesis